MGRPTEEQRRVLEFLALSGKFVSLIEVAHVRLVEADDDLFIPSLISRGWAEMAPSSLKAVRITPAGRAALAQQTEPDHG